MRAQLACALACCVGCFDKEPTLTLAELPDLIVHVDAAEAPWTSADPPRESHVEIRVLVFHDYDKRTCPELEPSFAVTANGVPLAEIELGGFDDNDNCDAPMARATFVQSADLGEDVDVVVSDHTRTVHASFPGLLSRSSISVAEPIGALAQAAKVRLIWAPEDLADARGDGVDTRFTQLAPPYAEMKMSSGYALVDGNEIRLSVPETLTWTGPTQLAISNIQLPYEAVACNILACGAERRAAAAVTVDLQ